MSSFYRGALVMMGGTALAQALPIALSPVISRLYDPQQYGLLTFFVGATTTLGTIATLRYELAIVLPQTEEQARAIALLAQRLLLIVCGVVMLATLSFADSIARLAGRSEAGLWVYALAPAAAALAWYQVSSFVATRHRKFGALAVASIAQQSVFVFAATGLGLLGVPAGLIAARLSGYCAGALALFPAGRIAATGATSSESPMEVGRRYRQFPLFNFPYSLIGTLGREFFVFALMITGKAADAGLYGLARSVVFVPTSFLSSSLSQPYYKEAATSFRTPRLEALTCEIVRVIARVFTPLFAAVAVIGQDLFEVVFSATWRTAGAYAAYLAPVALLSLFSSWPERIFEVAGRQGTSLGIQVAFDLACAGAALGLLLNGVAPLRTLAVVASLGAAYHVFYMAAAFRIARFRARPFLPIAGEIAALSALWALAAGVAHNLLGVGIVSLCVVAAGLVLYELLLVRSVLRQRALLKDFPA